MKQRRLNVAVVCGGNSGEYEISVQSGQAVAELLDAEKYEAYLIYIKSNSWYFLDKEGKRFEIQKDDFSLTTSEGKISFDVVFNAIHGTPGEDGKLPAYFEMLNIPCTSSSSVVLAATFNKWMCKQIVAPTGIALADSILLRKGDNFEADELIEALNLPLFVKPNSNGSSVGISKVNHAEELLPAIEKAFLEDSETLLESAVVGREVGCSVFDFKGRVLVLPITEIISKKDFFDYEAKYVKGMSDEITPAQIDEETDMQIKAVSAMLYKHIGCKGFVRFDYIITEDDLYFLEVNTVPGMTQASIMPQQSEVMGIALGDLFSMAVENALYLHSK